MDSTHCLKALKPKIQPGENLLPGAFNSPWELDAERLLVQRGRGGASRARHHIGLSVKHCHLPVHMLITELL